MFQTVCLYPLHRQIKVVRFIAIQLLIYLSSHLFSFIAGQALKMEELFTFPTVMANVFCMKYVVMIVTQHTKVIRIISLRMYK
jgi:hypothetical protein